MYSERETLSLQLQEIVEEVFDFLGFDLDDYVLTNDSMRGTALCHEDSDNPTGFTYYYEKGMWRCWTHQCHRIHGWDLMGLIVAVRKCSYKEAVKLAKELLDGHDVPLPNPNKKVAKIIEKKDYWRDHLDQKTFSNEVVNKLASAREYAKERGLAQDLFEEYGIGYALKGKMTGRVVVPIRNINGQIIGFSGRLIKKDFDGPKWLHLNLKKDFNMFNIDKASQHHGGLIYVTEGIWDTLKLIMAGIPNVVCIFGTHLSDGQIEILNRCKVMEVCLALDNDEAGQKHLTINSNKLKRSLFAVSKITPIDSKDFGDMRLDKVKQAISEKEYI